MGKSNNSKSRSKGGNDLKHIDKFPKLTEAIGDRGLKVTFVAASVGLTYRQLRDRRIGITDFELPVMRKLAKVLGVQMETLFG
jgi:hypothetical protein